MKYFCGSMSAGVRFVVYMAIGTMISMFVTMLAVIAMPPILKIHVGVDDIFLRSGAVIASLWIVIETQFLKNQRADQ
jgi:phosphate starvation-inducible membrane PsiE